MKLLLHACCGPCSLEPVRLLHEAGHDITIAYMNPNIEPADEYQHRLETLLKWARTQNITVIEGAYDNAAWRECIAQAWQPATQSILPTTNQSTSQPSAQQTTHGQDTQDAMRNQNAQQTNQPAAQADKFARPPQERCRACYRFRLEETARWAHEHGFDAISTTLTVSPYQHTEIIHEELLRAAKPYENLSIVFEDFRPYYPEATKRSKELGMYRQNYCGCAYSASEAQQEREERKAVRKAKKAQMKAEKLAMLTTEDFSYDLPEGCIAQEPATVRDACKLLVMNRKTGALQDKVFSDIYDLLQPGDLLIANETRVMPARLLGAKRGTGGAAEVFLLREIPGYQTAQMPDSSEKLTHAKTTAAQLTQAAATPPAKASAVWEVLVRPGKRLKPGALVDFTDKKGAVVLTAEILDWPERQDQAQDKQTTSQTEASTSQTASHADTSTSTPDVPAPTKGGRIARLSTPLASLDEALHAAGHTPLPPYIKNYTGDEELYQTVFSRTERSAAAPTAGLHFTPELIERLKAKGVGFETVDLEVGLDTFRIVTEERPQDHQIHTERYSVPASTVAAIERTKRSGGRVIAVGTTSVRSLESAWDSASGRLVPKNRAQTSLFILPGYEFKVVDGLITNFHVPKSTLMMLVSAFASRDNIMAAYKHALKRHYRFLSFGDAMFII